MPTETNTTNTGLRTKALVIRFDRLGPVPSRRLKNPPTYSAVRVDIPAHTSRSNDAMIGHITQALRAHARMWAPVDLDDEFTVSISLTPTGGKFLVDGGRNGTGTIEVVK